MISCATEPKTPSAPPIPAEFEPAQFQLARVDAFLDYHFRRIHSLQAEVNIRFSNSEGGRAPSTDAILAYQAPNRLYVRGYTKYIPQVFLLIVRGDRFWLYIPKEAVVFTGTREDLIRPEEIRLELNGFDILASLFSRPLRDREKSEKTKQDSFYIVDDYGMDQEQSVPWLARRLWINAVTLNVERELHYTQDNIQYLEVTRSQFFETEGWRLPKFVSLTRLRDQTTTVIMLWNAKVNIPLEENLFEFKTPNGVTVEVM